MTPKRHWLQNFKMFNGGKVLLGNDHECEVKGIGYIRLKLHDGSHKTLIVVRYIPELKKNLVSLGELDRNGIKFKGEGGVVKITKGSLVCMKDELRNGIYLLQATTLCGEAAAIKPKSNNKETLWHLRMSHISEQGLREL